MVDYDNKFDIFISHASEDKETVARPLTRALLAKGYNVFLDELVIKLGDSITESVNKGLSQAKYGVIIISPTFLFKKWTKVELNSIISLFVSSDKKLLPIWHGITYKDIEENIPLLVDIKAGNSSDGIESLVSEISRVIGVPANKHFTHTNYIWGFYDFIPELQVSILNNIRSICQYESISLTRYHSALESMDDFLKSIDVSNLSSHVQTALEEAKKQLENDILDDYEDLYNDR